MSLDDIERGLLALMPRATGRFPEGRLEDMIELTAAGEPLIALENFCSELVEWQVAISPAFRDEIARWGEPLGLAPSYLRHLIVERDGLSLEEPSS